MLASSRQWLRGLDVQLYRVLLDRTELDRMQ